MGYGRINALKAVLEAEQGTWYNAYQNKSLDNNATYSNGNRHLIKGAGYLHEVFTSDNKIFYRRKSESEGTWNITKRISDETSGNKDGSLLFRPSTNTLHVVWERQVSTYQYEVWYSKSNVSNINWSTPFKLATVNISSYQPGTTPVISYIGDPSKLVVVYCSSAGLYYKYSTNDGNSWNIPATLIFSNNKVRYLSLTRNDYQDIIQLAYDLRDWVGVYSRIYDGTNWSSAKSMGDITGTAWNRTVSIAFEPVHNRSIAAWRGQQFNGGMDPYYSIVFRAGKPFPAQNEWDIWFEVFQHPQNETAYSPSLTRFYPEGSGSDFGVDIVNSTTADRIQLKKYYIHEGTGWGWDDIEISNSGDWPNITDLGTEESDPHFIFTNQSGSPYQIELRKILWAEYIAPNQNSLITTKESNDSNLRRGVFRDNKTSSGMTVTIEPIVIQNTTGEKVHLPFKMHSLEDTAEISIKNMNDYLGIEPVLLPDDSRFLYFNWNISYLAGKDTLDDKNLNIFRDHFALFLHIEDKTNPNISLTQNITHLPMVQLGLNTFAGRVVEVKPIIQFDGILLDSLEFGIGNIYRPSNTTVFPKSATASNDGKLELNNFSLLNNYPNPFNPSTTISFDLPKDVNVRVEIFDITGRKICTLVNEPKEAGTYQVIWNGQDDHGNSVASGVYVYRIQAGDFVQSKKLLFLK